MTLGLCLAQVAPLYNLALVVIAIHLFVVLFKTPIKDRRAFIKPWGFIFAALMVFVIEEVVTVLRAMEVISIPIHINGFFELTIIILFIYALLLQKEKMEELD